MPTRRRTLGELRTKEEIATYRAENRLYQHRFHKMNKLRVKAAELIRNIEHRQTALKLTRESMSMIVTYINLAVKLPYRWTDEQYSRAWTTLNSYEKKYLGRVTRPDNQEQRVSDTVDSVNKVLNLAELTVEERAKVAYEVFKQWGTALYTTAADELRQTDANALLFLVQENKQNYPEWFASRMLSIIEEAIPQRKDRQKFFGELNARLYRKNFQESIERDRQKELAECFDMNSLIGR